MALQENSGYDTILNKKLRYDMMLKRCGTCITNCQSDWTETARRASSCRECSGMFALPV